MPTRPDLRQIATNVKDALADCDRDTLLDLLTFVLKEYVVEGPPPMLMHQAETIADLGGLSFAQLVTTLQTRLDLPELSLFAVDGERVSVRVGGVMQPLDATRVAPAAAELPRPAAGVHIVETTLPQRPPPRAATEPAASPPPPSAGQAPRPTGGLSLRGAPTAGGVGGGAPAAAQPAPAQPAAPAGAQPSAAPTTNDKKDTPEGDDASARFSLLELD
ncbi:MAG TPA: hypothetical protein VL463_32685 [Kofleriaceae bacterium]|nr:hypothetical protein [Kofleriaceae bacterium]